MVNNIVIMIVISSKSNNLNYLPTSTNIPEKKLEEETRKDEGTHEVLENYQGFAVEQLVGHFAIPEVIYN